MSSATTSSELREVDCILIITHYFLASTGFALETDTNNGKENQFAINGPKLFDVDPIRSAAILILPRKILKFLKIEHFFTPKIFQFFIDLTRHVVDQRKSGQTSKRNDLVQLLMDASVDQKDLDQMNYDKMIVSDEKGLLLIF